MNKALNKYFLLIKSNPQLFSNTGDAQEIKIIADREEIKREHSKLIAEYRAQGKSEDWIKIGVLVDDPWVIVIRDLVRFPDGRVGGYIRMINRNILEGGWGVVILPVYRNQVLLIKHFRHDDRKWYWEFPRGFGETNINAEENARKELIEELGVFTAKWIELGRENFTPTSGTAYFLATIPDDAIITLEKAEGIEKYLQVEIRELEQWLIDGRFSDVLSIKAFALAKIKQLL
jgi:ADP-ribose pyrophosphatase